MRIELFIPCFIDQLFPETAFNMIKILEHLDCDVTYNPDQTCCGQPAFNAGYWEDAKEVGHKFLKDFDSEHFIVAPSGSCVGYVRKYYDKVVEGDLQESGLAGDFSVQSRIFEFSEFLVKKLDYTKLDPILKGVAIYHDACGALRECGIKSEPRELLKNVRGLEVRESDDCEVCCGFGGSFAVKFDSISVGMAQDKIENAIRAGADYIISTDLSCLMHLDGYLKKHRIKLETFHIVDVLAKGW